MLDTWQTHKDVPKLQSLDHVVFSMAEVVGRIDESFLPPGIIDLPLTLERYAGMKGDARGLLRVRDFLRRNYDVSGFKANEKGVTFYCMPGNEGVK